MNDGRIDGRAFQAALQDTVQKLHEKREALNRINVFPVPDGDTGNNMLATLESAYRETQGLVSPLLHEVAEAAYRGAREGATGNSGTIFAQYLKGWATAFSNLCEADARHLSNAQKIGTKYAYKAVLKPVEGTILTVAREAAEAAAKEAAGGNLVETLLASYHRARKTLVRTGRVLPVLRSRKMIDAGGWGLLIFFSSILGAMNIPIGRAEFNFKSRDRFYSGQEDYSFENPYDMEFVVRAGPSIESEIRAMLASLGSELITEGNGNQCHVHIHTDNPLGVVEKTASRCSFMGLIIRDMRSQYYSMIGLEENNLKYKAIAFGKSPGFLAMFAMAGAQVAISNDMLEKKKPVLAEYNPEEVLLISAERIDLPCLKESVLVVGDEVKVLASLVSLYSSEKPSPEDVREAANYPRTACLVKTSKHFSARVKGLRAFEGSYRDCLVQAVRLLEAQVGEVLTIYYGKAGDRGKLEKLLPLLREEYPSLELIDLYFGGQEIPLVLSIE